jgi:hypothetical protein
MDKATKKAIVQARRGELGDYGVRKKLAAELGVSVKTIGRWQSEPPQPPVYRECPAPLRPRRPTAEEFEALLSAPPTAEEFGRPAPDKSDK